MSRTDYKVGVYLPQIQGSIDVQEIVGELAYSAVNALKDLSEVAFVEMYETNVRRDGYDNELFDELIQLVADVVDSQEIWDDLGYIDESVRIIIMGKSAQFTLSNPRLEKVLTDKELAVAEECAAELDNIVAQMTRPSRRGRRRDDYDDNRRGSRSSRSSRVRGSGRSSDRRPYNGGRSEYEPAPRRNGRDRGGRDRGGRGNFDYRGNERDGRGRNNNGRRPPEDEYYDIDDRRDYRGSHMTTKERLRREGQPARRAETVVQDRRGHRVPVGGTREVTQSGIPVRSTPLYQANPDVVPEARAANAGEILHEQEDGRRVLIIPATQTNMRQRKTPYNVLPLFPTTVDGYFTINSSGDITGVLGLPKSEEDMERQRHDVSRFFKNWGNMTRPVNHKATAKALGDIQSKALIRQMEAEIEEKYNLNDIETLPEVDVDKLYVAKAITTYEAHEDFVSTGQHLLLEDIEHENLRKKFDEKISDIPINYSAIRFCGFSLTGIAADKALELNGLVSFSSIRNKLIELEPLVPSSTLHELDLIATDWVNNLVKRKFGILKWDIDSFLLDIEDLIAELAKDYGISVAFTSLASGLVETVLKPLTNKDKEVCDLTGLTPDGELTVKFGKLSNITLLQIDSDELALFLEEECGSVTHDSWSSMATALDVISTLSKQNTAEMMLITRDNRKIYVDQGNTKGEHILSR